MRSWSTLKVAVSALTFVALAVWWLRVGRVDHTEWIAMLVAVPLVPLLAILVPPAKGNILLALMVLGGVAFALMPWVGRDSEHTDLVTVMFFGGLLCLVVSWVLFVWRYWAGRRHRFDWPRIMSR